MNLKNFKYTVDPNSDIPIMLINKHIGTDEEDGDGIIGSDFEAELMALDTMGKKRIDIMINSRGGSVIDGMGIYSAILNTKTPIKTVCSGICASIAGVIFQAGQERVMMDYGVLMVHNPYGGTKKSLDTIKEALVTMLNKKASLSDDKMSELMNRETWISSTEAKDLGLCDKIEKDSISNSLIGKSFDFINKAVFKILNKLQSKPINTKMEDLRKLNNFLRLNQDASIEATMDEVTKLVNKAKESENKIAEMEEAYNKKKMECDDALNALNEFKKKMAENEAENLVNKAIEDGKFKAEAKESLLKNAALNTEAFKAMVDAMPVNKVGFQMPINSGVVPSSNSISKTIDFVAEAMREIKNKK